RAPGGALISNFSLRTIHRGWRPRGWRSRAADSGGEGEETGAALLVTEGVAETLAAPDRAGLDERTALVGVGPADGVPILGREHDGLVPVVSGGDDDQLPTVDVTMTLEVMGVVPTEIFGR